jgi:predicted amidohydrolase
VKVGFIQFNPLFGKVEKNIETVESLMDGIVCDLLVLPELFSTGYTFSSRKEVGKYAETVPHGRTLKFLRRIAREKNMAVVGGFVERDGNKFFNSALLVVQNGNYFIYRKKHLFFKEKEYFDMSFEHFQVFPVGDGVKVGLIICFDWIFPESIRKLALLGAQIICHSANLVMPYCQDAMITRALENRVFIITSNRTGIENRKNQENRFTGMSQVISPQGRILVRADEKNAVSDVVALDPDIALDKNITPLNNVLEDRRDDIY